MPDAIEAPRPLSKSEARATFGLPQDGRLLGVSGAMDRRKGVDLLLRAFARAKLAPTDRLLVCGPQKPDIREIVRGEMEPLVRSGRVLIVDRVLSPAEVAESLCAMDVVCTPYPSHIGSASIVIRAAATPRPVLGSDFGWVHRSITQFNLGWTCPVSDLDAFAAAIPRALDQSSDWKPGEGAARFAAFHDYRNFKLCATARVRGLLGAPAPAAQRTWEWVLESADIPSAAAR